ncbi:heme biosynthesis protein HemY [Amaricoccus solimangrovi]|uniref:Tetratricopeptide repeat protein n=1 Tax=Amaricoccus solimangrovi TaxID=2589815 RepID=A0A501WLZ7_9RHOB|nr:heme biosynthesis HemY N-terminal domain-containing protein [Amaricoccus solimangrovi]TPE49385.1 tetratricopeptide repeat protein [Amaricoccus solimangrovi]
MLWSLIKVIVFVAIAVALAYGASYLLATPGEVRFAFGNYEVLLSPIGFVIALGVVLLGAYILMKLIGLIVATLRFLLGDETALSRHFARGRQRRGLDALGEAMTALASDDARRAMKYSAKAERLLARPDITRPMIARSAELGGDTAKARTYYKAMLEDPRSRFAAVQGLMRQQLDEGDTATALELAKKAFALRPDSPAILRQLFELQSQREDWAGARATLTAATQAKLLPRDVALRRDAVLSLADARASIAKGDTTRGGEAALQANKLAPTLVPAAALAAGVHVERGAKRKAVKTLTTAWSANPHPDLAAAFAGIEPTETPAQRRKRFETLIAARPDHAESHLLKAELALADEDFPAARKAMGTLAETDPTTRSLAIMAAVERGTGAPDAVVSGWLTKALSASRGPQWTCEKCNHVHTHWMPICENCGAFDTLAWKSALHPEDSSLAQSAMLPLIIGMAEKPSEQEPGAEAKTVNA